MRYFSFVVPDDNELEVTKLIYSEEEILAEFWQFWTTEMKGNGYADLISRENCIQDWVAYNWAQPEDVYEFKQGYQGKHFIINEFNMQDPTFSLATLSCVNDNGVVIDRFVNINTELKRCGGIEN